MEYLPVDGHQYEDERWRRTGGGSSVPDGEPEGALRPMGREGIGGDRDKGRIDVLDVHEPANTKHVCGSNALEGMGEDGVLKDRQSTEPSCWGTKGRREVAVWRPNMAELFNGGHWA